MSVHQWLIFGSVAVTALLLYLNLFVFNEQFLLEPNLDEFKVATEHLGEIGGVKFIISDRHGVLSFSSFLDYMIIEDKRFRNYLIQILKKFPSEAYFWECKSVSLTTLDSTAFEFVLIPSSELVGMNGSSTAFQDKFAACGTSKVTTFPNIGQAQFLFISLPATQVNFTLFSFRKGCFAGCSLSRNNYSRQRRR